MVDDGVRLYTSSHYFFSRTFSQRFDTLIHTSFASKEICFEQFINCATRNHVISSTTGYALVHCLDVQKYTERISAVPDRTVYFTKKKKSVKFRYRRVTSLLRSLFSASVSKSLANFFSKCLYSFGAFLANITDTRPQMMISSSYFVVKDS